jgi:hypothetical protein
MPESVAHHGLISMSENILHRLILSDQLLGSLIADARNSRHVVTAVTCNLHIERTDRQHVDIRRVDNAHVEAAAPLAIASAHDAGPRVGQAGPSVGQAETHKPFSA